MQVRNGLVSYLINDNGEHLYFAALAYNVTASFGNRFGCCDSTGCICSKSSETDAGEWKFTNKTLSKIKG